MGISGSYPCHNKILNIMAEREGKIQNRLERFFTLTGVSSMKRPKCRAFSQTLWLFHGYLGFFIPVNKILNILERTSTVSGERTSTVSGERTSTVSGCGERGIDSDWLLTNPRPSGCFASPSCRQHDDQTLCLFHGYLGFFIPVTKKR